MTEKELATEFSLCYQDLAVYTRKALWALHSNLELNDVLSECYLHCHTHRHLITEENPLIAMAKNWIKQNIIWTNSPLRRLSPKDAPAHKDQGYTPGTQHPEELIETWYLTLSQYQKRLWDMWHARGLRRGKEVSGYLDISLSSAYLVLKECRQLEAQLYHYITKNT